MTNFEKAILCMLNGDGYGEALCTDRMTPDQKDRFNRIKAIYLEECLKECEF